MKYVRLCEENPEITLNPNLKHAGLSSRPANLQDRRRADDLLTLDAHLVKRWLWGVGLRFTRSKVESAAFVNSWVDSRTQGTPRCC